MLGEVKFSVYQVQKNAKNAKKCIHNVSAKSKETIAFRHCHSFNVQLQIFLPV